MFLYPFRVDGVILLILVGFVPTVTKWIEKYTYSLKNGVCLLTVSAKGDCCVLERQGSGGDQNPKRFSDWRIFCAKLVFEEELKVQVPAQWWGTGEQHAVAHTILSPLGQSWVAKRSSLPGIELLSGHSLLQVGQQLMKSQSGSLAQTRWRQANHFSQEF